MIICELCTNWNDIQMAKLMIKVAKEKGAGLAKFQLYNAEDDRGKPHYDWVKAHELTFDQAKMLYDYGESIGMEVFFSIFSPHFVGWCERIKVKRYKIACETRDKPTLDAVLSTNKPLIISYRPDGDNNYLDRLSNTCDTWLYCVPKYPTMPQDVDFTKTLSTDGYSDHSLTLDLPKIALSRGARIMECHFILDKSLPAPDAPWSKTPDEISELVKFEKVVNKCLKY